GTPSCSARRVSGTNTRVHAGEGGRADPGRSRPGARRSAGPRRPRAARDPPRRRPPWGCAVEGGQKPSDEIRGLHEVLQGREAISAQAREILGWPRVENQDNSVGLGRMGAMDLESAGALAPALPAKG